MKSALFVDFDNVYSGLRRLDMAYAEAFASAPMRWLDWIATQLQIPLDPDATVKRRILVRRCYLNPVMYQRYRFGFAKAGFEIVDCPPMTNAGKTSTDIHMVLDMVDVLHSDTRYDEFIVFSADADFTPVLRKLRREDRRTTMFAAGATSAAYDASSDLIIDPEAFISQALDFGDQTPGNQIAPDFEGLLAQAEALTWEMVEKANGTLPIPALTKALATRIVGLTDSNWAGRGHFTGLLRDLALSPLVIDREANCIRDPRRSRPEGASTNTRADDARPAAPTFSTPAPGASSNTVASSGVQRQVAHVVTEEVAASPRPIAVARLAHLVRQRCPGIERDWNGAGSFKLLLESLQLEQVQLFWTQLTGYAYDPARHSLDFVTEAPQHSPEQDPRWAQVGPLLQVAGFPALPGHGYRVFLESLAQNLQESQGASRFSLTAATARIRDLCADRKMLLARADVHTLLRALLFNGFDPGLGPQSFEELVATSCGVIAAACAREGLTVNDADRAALLDWMLSPKPGESS